MYVIFLKLNKSVLDVIQSVYANEEIKYRNYNKQYGHRFEYATRAVSLYDIQSASIRSLILHLRIIMQIRRF